LRRAGDEGLQGQGQPRPGERTAAQEARILSQTTPGLPGVVPLAARKQPMRLLLLVLASLLLGACASGRGPVDAPGYRAEGHASWYGSRHQGRRTASGEAFDQNALTAAHRQLPFGTRVRVTHLG